MEQFTEEKIIFVFEILRLGFHLFLTTFSTNSS